MINAGTMGQGSGGQAEWLTYLLQVDSKPFVDGLQSGLKGLQDFDKKAGDNFKHVGGEAKKFGNDAKKGMDDFVQGLKHAAMTLGAINLTRHIMGPAKAFASFQGTLNTYKAVSNATSKEMKVLTAEIYKQGKATQYSSQKIGQTTVEMAKLGLSTKETLQALPGVIAAASASGADLAFTAELVAGSLGGFSLAAEKASLVADTLAQVANVSAADMKDLFYTFKFLAPVAKGANQSLAQVSASVSILGNNLIKGGTAGTSMKNILINLQSESKQVKDIFDEFNISVTDAHGALLPLNKVFEQLRDRFKELNPTQQSAKLEQLFGREALPAAQVLMKTTKEEFDKMLQSFENVGGQSQKTAAVINQGLGHSFAMLTSSVETAKIEFGRFYEGPLVLGLEALTKITNMVGKLPAPIQKTAAATLGLAAAMATLYTTLGSLIFFGGKVTALFGKGGAITGSMAKLPLILSSVAHWMGWITIGVVQLLKKATPLIAFVTALYTAFELNLGGIKEHLSKFTKFFKDQFVDPIKKNWAEAIKSFSDTWNGLWTGMKDTVFEVIKLVDKPLRHFFDMIAEISTSLGYLKAGEIKLSAVHAEAAKAHGIALIANLANPLDKDRNPEREYQDGRGDQALGASRGFINAAIKIGRAAHLMKQTAGIQAKGMKDVISQIDKDMDLKRTKFKTDSSKIDVSDVQAETVSFKGKGFYPNATKRNFGKHWHPIYGGNKMHYGEDYAMQAGTMINARQGGVVETARFIGGTRKNGKQYGHGNRVVINHGGGWKTGYSHGEQGSFQVKKGQRVEKGQGLMKVGSTGGSTGPHLHYNVYKDGKAVNPNLMTQAQIGAESAKAAAALEKQKVITQAYIKELNKQILKLEPFKDKYDAKKKLGELEKEKAEELKKIKDQGAKIALENARRHAAEAKAWLDAHKAALAEYTALYSSTQENLSKLEKERVRAGITDQKELRKLALEDEIEKMAKYVQNKEDKLEQLYAGGHLTDDQYKAGTKALRAEEDALIGKSARDDVPNILGDVLEKSEKIRKSNLKYLRGLDEQAAKLHEYNRMMTDDLDAKEEERVILAKKYKLLEEIPHLLGDDVKQQKAKMAVLRQIQAIEGDIVRTTEAQEKKRQDEFLNVKQLKGIMNEMVPIAAAVGQEILGWVSGMAASNSQMAGLLDVGTGVISGITAALKGDFGTVVASLFDIIGAPGKAQIQQNRQNAAQRDGRLSAEARMASQYGQLEALKAEGLTDPIQKEQAGFDNFKSDEKFRLGQLGESAFHKNRGLASWMMDETDFKKILGGDRKTFEKHSASIGLYPDMAAELTDIVLGYEKLEEKESQHNKKISGMRTDAAAKRVLDKNNETKAINAAERFLQNRLLEGQEAFATEKDTLNKRLLAVDMAYGAEAKKINDAYGKEIKSLPMTELGQSKAAELISKKQDELNKNDQARLDERAEARTKYNQAIKDTVAALNLEGEILKASMTDSPVDDAVHARTKALRDLSSEEAATLASAAPGTEAAIKKFYEAKRKVIMKEFDDKIDAYREAKLDELHANALKSLEREREMIAENLDLQTAGHEARIKGYEAELAIIDADRKKLLSEIEDLEAKLRGDLSNLDANDKTMFINQMMGMDLEKEVKEGLENISNMDQRGVDRTSSEAQELALTDQIDYLERKANSDLKYENITAEEHAKILQKTAMLRAKHAKQRLDTEDLNRTEAIALEEAISDAFVQFKQYEIEIIEGRYQDERNEIQETINRKEQEITAKQAQIATEKALIAELEAVAAEKYAAIEAKILSVSRAQDGWTGAIQRTQSQFDAALDAIMSKFESAKGLLESGISAEIGLAEGSETSSNSGGSTSNLPYRVKQSSSGSSINWDIYQGNKKVKTIKGSSKETSQYWMQGQKGFYSSVDDYSFTDMLYNYNPKEYAGTYHTGGMTRQEGFAKVLRDEMIIPPDVTQMLISSAQDRASNISNSYGSSVFSPSITFKDNHFDSGVDVEAAVSNALATKEKEMVMDNRAYRRPFR